MTIFIDVFIDLSFGSLYFRLTFSKYKDSSTAIELLSKVFSLKHPDAAYLSQLMKFFDLNEYTRRQAKVDLFNLRKSRGGLTYIEGCRLRLCNKLFKLNNYFPWYKISYPPLCTKHPPIQTSKFSTIECQDCMAEFEVMCIVDEDYFDDMICIINRNL